MKTRNILFAVVAMTTIIFTSCENTGVAPNTKDFGILPERFKVDVPASISNKLKSANLKSTEGDTLSGNEIYEHLTNFIAIGEASADIVEDIIWAITVHHIEDVMSITFAGDDGRVKNLVVNPNVLFDDVTWEYALAISDADSESNDDGGMAIQVFWNKSPIEGITILKPYNIDRIKDANAENAMFRIDYSEAGNDEYDAYMEVEISGLPLSESDVYAMETMKMFVGKKGDRVDVFGNSNHPNAQFNYAEGGKTGFNWAFVASGSDEKDIAVAEVGLPSSMADITSHEEILDTNSVYNVLEQEMTSYIIANNPQLEGFETAVAAFVAPYLMHAEAPGYFNNSGFVQAGSAPNESYGLYESRIAELTPFNPLSISKLKVAFN